ncbi:MAG: TRAP transporter small permease [Aquabacterium sp.]
MSARRAEQVLGTLSALPLALIVALTFADVFARYLFARPIRGSVEVIQYAMALVIFTALPLVTRSRGHVSVSLIDHLMRGGARRLQRSLCDAVSLLALAVLTWRLAAQALSDMASSAKTIVLGLPQAPLVWLMCGFCAISTLIMARLLLDSLADRGDAEAPP